MEAARWVQVGRQTFRFDLAVRFEDETDEDGQPTGAVVVILGKRDRFTVGDGEGADILRQFVADVCRPDILESDESSGTTGYAIGQRVESGIGPPEGLADE